MKHLYRHILASAIAVTTLVACSKEDIQLDVVRDCPTFAARIYGAHTRATDDYWDAGDRIGISGCGAINVCHVTQPNDTLKVENPEQQIYFQSNDSETFTAYYPYNSSRDAISGLINISTADQTNQKDFDCLWSTAEGSKAAPNVIFNFTHRMSKISFVFKNGNDMDVSDINKIRLNGLVVDGTFDTITGTCQVNEDSPTAPTVMTLTDVMEDEAVTPLFLFPQKVAGSVKLEIYDRNSQYFVCNLTIPDNELAAATNYTYTITVNKTGLNVTEATLSDWITAYGEDSEASSADE